MSDTVSSPRPEADSMSTGGSRRRRVLAIAGTYLPGTKSGGHIQSIAAMANHLCGRVEMFVVCRDRDIGDDGPYPGLQIGAWNKVDQSQVLYLRRYRLSLRLYKHLIREVRPDVVYVNTVFSLRESILPMLLRRWSNAPWSIVAAPRGCLDPGALTLKKLKKRIFLILLHVSRVTEGVTWQASTELEAAHISTAFRTARIVVASNLPPTLPEPTAAKPTKNCGSLRLLFFSRVCAKKNLMYLLDRLEHIKGTIELTIAGPLEDQGYWAHCQARLDNPRLAHVRAQIMGPVPRPEVPNLIASHHLFALPTLAENFGHVIIEALRAGTGVLVSDRTPWRGLADLGAGWDLPLEDPKAWTAALQRCCDMDDREHQRMARSARNAADTLFDLDLAIRQNLDLFDPEPGRCRRSPA